MMSGKTAARRRGSTTARACRFGGIAAAILVLVAAITLGAVAGANAQTPGPQGRTAAIATSASFAIGEGEGTRFVLELSAEPRARVFVVDGPPRLVIDLDDVSFGIAAVPEAAGVVTGWRFGALTPSTGRIVFDLDGPALVSRRFFLPALAGRPGRLVLDLATVSPAAFARAAAGASAVARSAEAVARDDGGTGVGGAEPLPVDPAAPVVVIDPGHGGIDPGAGRSGTLEKDLVLAFCERLRDRLSLIPGLTVRLTRSDDTFLSLNRRIRVARAYGADLFISVHADAAPQDFVQGASVYTLSERASDAQAAAIAARENLADAVSGAIEPQLQEDVSGILADLLRRETKSLSFEFAERLIGALGSRVRLNGNAHRQARFVVLMANDIPSVLLELGYLTNPADQKELASDAWQTLAADAIAVAVADYFGLNLAAGPGAVPPDSAVP